MSDDLKPEFDPEDYLVIVETQPVSLRPSLEDMVRPHTAFMVMMPLLDDKHELAKASSKNAIASIHWLRLDIALGRELGYHPMFDVADAYSADLMHVAEMVFDEDGEFLLDLDLTGTATTCSTSTASRSMRGTTTSKSGAS